MRKIRISVLLISACCLVVWTCNNRAEAGQSRNGQNDDGFQVVSIEIQINQQVPEAARIEQSLKDEFAKTGQAGTITFTQVQGDPLGDRYLVSVGKDVPPNLLMRIKKVLRLTGASQATFRTEQSEAPNRIFIGQPL